jgi:hypothetical protein
MDFEQDNKRWSGNVDATLSWEQVFYDISPRLDEGNASDEEIVETLVHATRFIVPKLVEQAHSGAANVQITGLTRTSLQTILTQFKALGLISRNGASKTSGRSWKLTPLGESKMNALFAIPSKENSRRKAGGPTAKKTAPKKG